MTTPPRNISLNKEHVEDYQAEADARREENKKNLSPDDLRRLEVIEKASAMLKEAGVEFYLHATSPNWFFFYFKNDDESKYFEDAERFGCKFLRNAIIEGEKFLRRGLSSVIHGANKSGPLHIGPLAIAALKQRAAENGLTPPPDSI